MTSLLANFGMLLQFLGLGLLPLAIVANLLSSDSYVFGVSNMLVLMVAGVTVFYIGWFIRGFAEHDGKYDEDDDEETPRKRKKKKKKSEAE